ncbi:MULTISPECIES: helix-turn-helix domain-containing protein [unclassified Streptomyces]|uniref:PucR family transcriptional regulator n=1 Tax=unclassified Streptomyces TaxID=2593676 RepID=UPI00131AED6C|nr:helix-turn-helix domain-containing protein [Streptomyces sp. CB01635]
MSDHKPENSGAAGQMAADAPRVTGQTGADAPVTLATVVDCLGPGTVAVCAAPHGLGAPVRTLAVHEGPAGSGRSGPDRPGGLLLGIGTGGEARELIRAAAGSGASAVIVKNGGDGTGLRDAGALGTEHGVAVLALAADQDWTDLIGRLRALLAVRIGPGTQRAAMLGRRHDLVSLANALSRLVNGSVMIFTPSQELLATSRLGPGDDEMRRAAVLDQHGPVGYRARLVELGVYRRLWSGSEVVDVAAVPELGAGRRLAAAVRAGTENLGSIWVAEGAEPLAANASALLADAATVALGVLLGLDQEEVARRRLDEELFGRALLGDVDPRLAASHLAVEPGTPVSVMIADLSAHDARLGAADLYRAREEALRRLAGYRWRALATTGPSRVVLALVGPADRDGMRRAADAVGAAVAEAVGARPRIGIGPCVPHLGELPASRMEAELVVRALARRDEVRSACLEDVRGTANLLLLGETVTADRRLQEGPVHRLRAHDQRRGTAYTETLAAYLDAFGDTAAASRELNVHANTLRYRLGRIRELTGLDLGDPYERLNAAVQLFALGPAGLVVEHEKIPKTSSPPTNRGGAPGLHTTDHHHPATGTGL